MPFKRISHISITLFPFNRFLLIWLLIIQLTAFHKKNSDNINYALIVDYVVDWTNALYDFFFDAMKKNSGKYQHSVVIPTISFYFSAARFSYVSEKALIWIWSSYREKYRDYHERNCKMHSPDCLSKESVRTASIVAHCWLLVSHVISKCTRSTL